MNDEPSVPLFHQQQINAVGRTLRSGLSKGANIEFGCGAPPGRSDMSAPPAPFRAKGAATRGWFPACRWHSPGLPAACSHPAADVPRCRSAGGYQRARGSAPCHPGRRRGTPSRRECRREAGRPGVAGRGGIADCGRSPGRPGTAAITGGSPGGAGGITGVPSWTPSGGGTLGRSAGASGTGPVAEIGRHAGVKTRRRRDRTSAGTDGTRVQSGIGRNGQAGGGGRRAVPWTLAARASPIAWGTCGLRAGSPGGATRISGADCATSASWANAGWDIAGGPAMTTVPIAQPNATRSTEDGTWRFMCPRTLNL